MMMCVTCQNNVAHPMFMFCYGCVIEHLQRRTPRLTMNYSPPWMQAAQSEIERPNPDKEYLERCFQLPEAK